MTTSDVPAGSVSIEETFLRPFMKLSSVQPGERVLDLVCGEGAATLEAIARCGETGEVLALDPYPIRLEVLRERARAAGLKVPETHLLDGPTLPTVDSYWDIALCHFGLPELADPEATIHEVLRVLRPVGRMTISSLGEPDRCPMVSMFLDALSRHVPSVAAFSRSLFRFSETGKLANLLASQGFQDAVPERLTEWVPFRGIDEYWQAMTANRTFGRLAARLSPEAVAECKSDLEHRTRFYRRGHALEIKVEAIVLSAVR